jgi:hypothetical protein
MPWLAPWPLGGGADDETRTRDIDLGKVALYQLSYIRTAGLPVSRAGRRMQIVPDAPQPFIADPVPAGKF